MSHWKNISISSSEQSERNYLQNIKKIVSYQDYVENCSHDQKIILDTKSQKMLPSIYDNLANYFSKDVPIPSNISTSIYTLKVVREIIQEIREK